jgi:hypothetical protein
MAQANGGTPEKRQWSSAGAEVFLFAKKRHKARSSTFGKHRRGMARR